MVAQVTNPVTKSFTFSRHTSPVMYVQNTTICNWSISNSFGISFGEYSRLSVLRTLVARLPWLFELVLDSLRKKSHRSRYVRIKGNFHIENSILCVLIRIASMRRF